MLDFHGWMLPMQYEGILAEHAHCRRAACVFDTCHMGRFHISGPDAAAALAAVCTQDAAALPVGRCRYGFLLNDRGGILDDTILIRLGRQEFLLVVNAAPARSDLQWLQSHLTGDVRLVNRTASWGKLDLQGPASFAVLKGLVEGDLAGLTYFSAAAMPCCGVERIVSRTGYTGELGYEIMLPTEAVGELFERIVSHEAVKPAGLGARDLLRLEMCYPLYGQDMCEDANPLEADMGRFVDLGRDFIGAEALRAAAGVERKLVAFRTESRRKAASGQEITVNDSPVGAVTSAAFSPSLGVSIGMGYVRADLAAPGAELTIRHPRGPLPAAVAARPLYKKGTCRTRNLS